ncbi:MAG: type II toxin-antitoxin system RelB/DinJ family antitoxin [Oscillospiraceae bacterium]|nr:type II toxin-antitoxin system RelB/DinJ family antitoxin [Oscillospiraceae bacterium]
MTGTANLFARVEPEIKEKAENILSELDIPMSYAVTMFLEQVIIHGGMPFEVKDTVKKPLCLEDMTKEELDAELEKGMKSIRKGQGIPAEEVRERMHRLHGI